jgi:hypothetical protein
MCQMMSESYCPLFVIDELQGMMQILGLHSLEVSLSDFFAKDYTLGTQVLDCGVSRASQIHDPTET